MQHKNASRKSSNPSRFLFTNQIKDQNLINQLVLIASKTFTHSFQMFTQLRLIKIMLIGFPFFRKA
jgi:tRNA isopentenyl-2-thiomethyl-A-37 hydroxylase MiaE